MQFSASLVPRASFPLTSGRKTQALGATISGMRHRCRCAVSRITRIRLFPLFFHNGCSQSSRFPTAGQGERSSGNEIADCQFILGDEKARRMSSSGDLPRRRSFRHAFVSLTRIRDCVTSPQSDCMGGYQVTVYKGLHVSYWLFIDLLKAL